MTTKKSWTTAQQHAESKRTGIPVCKIIDHAPGDDDDDEEVDDDEDTDDI